MLLPTLGGSGDLPALTPAGSPASAPGPAGPLQLPEMEVLFEIQSRQFLVPMNSSLDYSYFDAPRSASWLSLPCNITPRHGWHCNVKLQALLDLIVVYSSARLCCSSSLVVGFIVTCLPSRLPWLEASQAHTEMFEDLHTAASRHSVVQQRGAMAL